jgi:hypothetical protein
MTTLEKIKAELEAFEAKKKVFVEDLRKEFPTMFKELFDKSEKIESFSWTQYTPYFNDGDTCEFRVSCDDPYVNGEYIDECDWYDWRIHYYLKGDQKYTNLLTENPELDIETYKVVAEFISVIESIPKDFLKDLFGDHAQITIHKDGRVEVDEYEHD